MFQPARAVGQAFWPDQTPIAIANAPRSARISGSRTTATRCAVRSIVRQKVLTYGVPGIGICELASGKALTTAEGKRLLLLPVTPRLAF